MDPDHRDRVAFLRICSGRFERGATATLARTGKPRAARELDAADGPGARRGRGGVRRRRRRAVRSRRVPHRRHAGREAGPRVRRHPHASRPSTSARVELAGVERRKALAKGLDQLAQEGVVQLFTEPGLGHGGADPRRGRPAAVRRARRAPGVRVRGRAPARAAAVQRRALGARRVRRGRPALLREHEARRTTATAGRCSWPRAPGTSSARSCAIRSSQLSETSDPQLR